MTENMTEDFVLRDYLEIINNIVSTFSSRFSLLPSSPMRSSSFHFSWCLHSFLSPKFRFYSRNIRHSFLVESIDQNRLLFLNRILNGPCCCPRSVPNAILFYYFLYTSNIQQQFAGDRTNLVGVQSHVEIRRLHRSTANPIRVSIMPNRNQYTCVDHRRITQMNSLVSL